MLCHTVVVVTWASELL